VKAVSKQYAGVFFLGFLGMTAALLFGGMSGHVLNSSPVLVALRYLSGGLMIAGFTMWIVYLRQEAGKPGPNALLVLLVVFGIAALLVNLIYPVSGIAEALQLGGLAAILVALAIGAGSMLVAPAYPTLPTMRWPEGGEQPAPHSHETGSSSH
jgi:hypothetical protein